MQAFSTPYLLQKVCSIWELNPDLQIRSLVLYQRSYWDMMKLERQNEVYIIKRQLYYTYMAYCIYHRFFPRRTRHYTCTCHFLVYELSASTSSGKIFPVSPENFFRSTQNFSEIFFENMLIFSSQTFFHTKQVKILRNFFKNIQNSGYWKIAGLRPAIFRGTS